MSHEQRQALDAQLRRPRPRPEVEQTPQALRAWFAELMAPMQVPAALRMSPTQLGDRGAVLVESTARTRPGTILYFHGGSYIVGSPQTAMSLTGNLVTRTGLRALSLDYRLAPEHPFPAAIEDAVAAYRALLDDGRDPSSIVFAGDSAGGGLTVTACLAAREAGLPMPAAIVAFSPGFDATRTGASMDTRADADPFFTREALDALGALYLAGQDPDQELLAPAIRADLSGFPPMLLQAGTHEVLLDDSTRLAARARDHDVDVILDIVGGVPHVFQSYVGQLEEADQALDRAALFISQRLVS
jgi:epsilon-lactone hydrolase